MILALLNPALTAVEKMRPTREEVAVVYPGIIFGDLRNVAEHTLVDFPRLVLMHETSRPPLGFGDAIEQGPPTKHADGTWHQVWAVTPPNLAELKQTTKARANEIAIEKISTLELALGLIAGTARPRTVQVVNKRNEVLTRIDAATTAAEVQAILDELSNV